jgi:cell division protein FtsZ
MGVGFASGDGRAEKAAIQAINSPLLDISINGAKGVLFALSSNDDLTMAEFQDAAKVITESIDKDARVIIGTIIDDRMKKGELKITVIATGFPSENGKKGTLFGTGGRELFNRQESSLPERPAPSSQPSEERPFVQKPEVKTSEPDLSDSVEDDLDNFGAIPAFLRRNKK